MLPIKKGILRDLQIDLSPRIEELGEFQILAEIKSWPDEEPLITFYSQDYDKDPGTVTLRLPEEINDIPEGEYELEVKAVTENNEITIAGDVVTIQPATEDVVGDIKLVEKRPPLPKDGDDGYTPIKWVDYFDGDDGYTPIKWIDYFDGEDGKDGMDGEDWEDGKDGKPPKHEVSEDRTKIRFQRHDGIWGKWIKAPKGEDGEKMTFQDLTPQERESLVWPTWPRWPWYDLSRDFKDTYSASIRYKQNESVIYNWDVYFALTGSINKQPDTSTSHWKKWWAYTSSGGSGDMGKATYDTNDDGIVNEADAITNQWALATLDTVDTAQIEDDAVSIDKVSSGVETSLGKADSALQSEDIDTFAELDAIVADKSLVNLEDGGTFTSDIEVPDEAYDATSWNGNNEVATKNAIRDKFESLAGWHDPVTVTDSDEIDFTLTDQDITAIIKTGSIDESKLDTSVNASLDLADSAIQSGDNISELTNDSGFTDDTTVNAHIADTTDAHDASAISVDDSSFQAFQGTTVQAVIDFADTGFTNARATGVLSGGGVTFTVWETVFDVEATAWEIKDSSGYYPISYAGATDIAVSTTSATSIYVYIDNAWAIQQQTTAPEPDEFREKLFLTRLAFSGGTLVAQEPLINPIGGGVNHLRDYLSYVASPYKGMAITGNSDLTFRCAEGSIFELGTNFSTDTDNPNVAPFDEEDPVTFFYVDQDSTLATWQTNINVTQYDNGGSQATMTNNRFKIETVYRFNSGNFVIQQGQNQYNTLDEAQTALSTRTFNVNPSLAEGTRLGWIIVQKNATDLSDTAQARFLQDNGSFSTSVGTSGALIASNNLSDLDSASTARTNLGLEIDTDVQSVLSEWPFVDGDKTKLDGIETSADVTDTDNVRSAWALMDDEVTNLAQVKAFDSSDYATASHTHTHEDITDYDTELAGKTNTTAFTPTADYHVATKKYVDDNAGAGTVDTFGTPVANDFARFTDANTIEGRSYSEVRSDLGLVIGTNVQAHSAVLDATTASFTTADETKLDGIEASADVTDTANVTSAGALMDSELTDITFIKALSDADTSTVNTGTSTTWVVTPDSLAGSYAGTKTVQATVVDYTTDVATGDGQGYIHIPASVNGMNLVTVHAEVITAGTTGTTDIQIHNVTDAVDMLSTKLTIDSGETGSDTGATPAVINTSNDDVATNDLLRIDVDAVSTTAPKGLIVTLEFRIP